MKALAWLLTVSTLSLFIRFSFAADNTQQLNAPTQITQQNKASGQYLSPKQLTNKLAKTNQKMLDDSGQILFA